MQAPARRAAAVAALLVACAGRGLDLSALEARHPELRGLAPHRLGDTRPYALPLDGALVLFLCRWPTEAPIPVSFTGEPEAAQRAALAAALRSWESAGLGVRFAPGDAGGIRVHVRDDLVTSQANATADCAVSGPPGPGDAEVPDARLVAASIHVARADPHLRETLLHELGHALGFQGHAPRGRTLMLAPEAAALAGARRVGVDSPVDDAALRALYAVPSGAIVARVAVSRAQTLPADRARAIADAQGLAGPFARMGDRSGLLWWGSAGRRLVLRIEGARRALRRREALRVTPASREAERLLGAEPGAPARPVPGATAPVEVRAAGAQNPGRPMPLSLDLANRRLLVVGASSGVGRAVGALAGRAGARVAFAARRRERLAEAAAATPGAVAVACDVRSGSGCADAVAEAVEALGGLDALVYAAGMSPLGLLETATQEEWRTVLDTNLVGAALVTAAALPALRATRGRAVYVSSYAVRQPLPGVGLYRVSKVALDALIEAWRMEHPEVEFTRVVLGNTNGTEFAHGWGPERTESVTRAWVERGLFPAPTMMPVEAAAEAVLSVLALRGFVDDIAVMPRTNDPDAATIARGERRATRSG